MCFVNIYIKYKLYNPTKYGFFVTVLKLHHDYSVSIFPTRDSTSLVLGN